MVNLTRLAGLFGNASVGYKITGMTNEVMDIEDILGGHFEGRVFMIEGERFVSLTLPISSQVSKKRKLIHCNQSYFICLF